MAGLFTWKYNQFKNQAAFDVMGRCVCVAQGAAETLKLNMALILLPMCRITVTCLGNNNNNNNNKHGVAFSYYDHFTFHQVSISIHCVRNLGLIVMCSHILKKSTKGSELYELLIT